MFLLNSACKVRCWAPAGLKRRGYCDGVHKGVRVEQFCEEWGSTEELLVGKEWGQGLKLVIAKDIQH